MTAHEDILRRAREIDAPQPDNEMEASTKPIPLKTESEIQQSSTTSNLGNFIRENPGPSLLIGAGLAWLMVNRERERSRSLPTRLRARAQSAKDTTVERVGSAREATSSTLESAREATGTRIDSAKQSLASGRDAAEQKYRTMLDENPLALGACALAAGLAIGLMIPPTAKENELLGDASDSLMEQARDIVNEARRAAVNTLRSSKEDVQEKLIEARDEAKGAIQDSVDEAKQAFQDEVKDKSPE